MKIQEMLGRLDRKQVKSLGIFSKFITTHNLPPPPDLSRIHTKYSWSEQCYINKQCCRELKSEFKILSLEIKLWRWMNAYINFLMNLLIINAKWEKKFQRKKIVNNSQLFPSVTHLTILFPSWKKQLIARDDFLKIILILCMIGWSMAIILE